MAELWMLEEPDLHGPAGFRCCAHGARRCTVHGCERFARGSVETEDQWGPAGRRCQTHITTRRRWCNVPGCGRFPRGLVDASDALGAAGYRCALHGCGCCVVGCRKNPWGRVSSADAHGPAGRRCWIHGGQCCDVPGCRQTPRRRVTTADQHGAPGVRCDLHSVPSRRRLHPGSLAAERDGDQRCKLRSRYRSTLGATRQRRCSRPQRRRIVMADGTPSLRCIAHRTAPSVPEAMPSAPEAVPERSRCRMMSQYKGKSGEKRIWRCGKMCQDSGYCEYHEAYLKPTDGVKAKRPPRIWAELSEGGVCGFSLLHFAAFAGKSKACQALIDLGVNVNAKTQPLCVTASQQFCRPTPLDVTTFIGNKRVREQTQKVLQAADASWGAVLFYVGKILQRTGLANTDLGDLPEKWHDLDSEENLDTLWQGLMKHQLLLIKDEVVKYNSKIPSALRRVLRTEPRWREIVNFPGEDAATMAAWHDLGNTLFLRKAFKVWRRKLLWVLIGDSSMPSKRRLGVVAWNLLLFLLSWWLFGFQTFELLQAILVAIVLMVLTSLVRHMGPEELWQKLPEVSNFCVTSPFYEAESHLSIYGAACCTAAAQEDLQSKVPRHQMEQQLQKAWHRLCHASIAVEEILLMLPGEVKQLRSEGLQSYATRTKDRFDLWLATVPEKEEVIDDEEEEEAKEAKDEQKRKKSAAIASKIKEIKAGEAPADLRRNKGRRRHVK
eukprot:s824_g17.t1